MHLPKVYHYIHGPTKAKSKETSPLWKSWTLWSPPSFPHRSQCTIIIWNSARLKSIRLPFETHLGTPQHMLSCPTQRSPAQHHMPRMLIWLFPKSLHKLPPRDCWHSRLLRQETAMLRGMWPLELKPQMQHWCISARRPCRHDSSHLQAMDSNSYRPQHFHHLRNRRIGIILGLNQGGRRHRMALHIEGCMLFFRVFWPICGISDNRYCTVPPTVIRILHSTVISVEHRPCH